MFITLYRYEKKRFLVHKNLALHQFNLSNLNTKEKRLANINYKALFIFYNF